MADIDSSLLLFCGEIKREATVALSGECADEVFGGYPWFHREEFVFANTFPWAKDTNARLTILNKGLREKLPLVEYVQGRYADTLAEVPQLPGENAGDKRRRELFYLNMVWFMQTLLDRKDRMSMAKSLEVRVPFCDHRLVEYVWNIPWEMKAYAGREKGILRLALKGILPDEIIERKKSPYPKTHHPKYTKLVCQRMQSILDDPSSPILQFIDKDVVQEMVNTGGASFKKPWYGQLMTGPQLLAHLVQIDLWFRVFDVKVKAGV
jgi:asparagine synthase (glutamine-hydrolysing)